MMVVAAMLFTACQNNSKERKLLGKWQLTEMAISTDGGMHFNRQPVEEDQVLILLEDGVALYPNGILGETLDSATWRVYSNGDSLEVHDEQRKYTGMYDNYRIQKMYKSVRNGIERDVMELTQTGENHTPLFGGASTIIILMRYEKVDGSIPGSSIEDNTQTELSYDDSAIPGAPMQKGPVVQLKPSEYNSMLLTDGMLFYKVLSEEEHTMEVMGGSDNCTDVVIPLQTESNGQKYRVVSVNNRAFVNHPRLRSVVVHAGIESIGKHAFAGSPITSATIGCKIIGRNAFEKCGNLRDLTLSEGVEKILEEAFIDCHSLMEVHCPNSLKSIPTKAFYRLSNLTTVTLGDGLESIGEAAFEDCISLSTVHFGSGLQQIAQRAFNHCRSLESVQLQTGLKSIGYHAFWGCKSMTSLTLPEGLQSIENFAFSRCDMLESVVIPSSVTTLENCTFNECKSLKFVQLPEGIKEIPTFFLSECPNLKNITFPQSITKICEYAFYKTGLEQVTIPEGVEELEKGSFGRCPLKEVTLPSTIKKIGSDSFSYCDSITIVRCKATEVPKLSNGSFFMADVHLHTTLQVPASAIDAYTATEPWNKFKSISPL